MPRRSRIAAFRARTVEVLARIAILAVPAIAVEPTVSERVATRGRRP
jgi:hypothetical protein